MEIVGASLLASMALATQLLYDVRMPHGHVRPPVLTQLVIAESGDRKSTVQRLALAPYYDFDTRCSLAHEAHTRLTSELSIWRRKVRHLEQAISQLEIQYQDANSERMQLDQLLKMEPRPDLPSRLIFENMTGTAFYEALRGEGRSIVILSDEAGSVLRSSLFTQSGLLNKGWDGAETLSLDRAGQASIVSRRPRVSSLLMVQPSVWTHVMSKRGDALRASGYFARMLPVFATSMQGFRTPSPESPSEVHLNAFHQEVREKLCSYEEQLRCKNGLRRTTLDLTVAAKGLLREISQDLEQRIAPGMPLRSTRDFASKAVENICRVAASLHIFTDKAPAIEADIVEKAAKLVYWHGNQFQLIFSPNGPLSQNERDAMAILNYIQSQYWSHRTCAPLSEALRNGPIRPKSRFDACIELLRATARVGIAPDPSTGKPLITPPQPYVTGIV